MLNANLLQRLTSYFETQPIDKAWIFGSYARGEESSESDMDFIVHFQPNANISLFKYVRIVKELESITGQSIDLVEDGHLKPFAEESAQREKILIYDGKDKRQGEA